MNPNIQILKRTFIITFGQSFITIQETNADVKQEKIKKLVI